MDALTLKIVSPEGVMLETQADYVNLPTPDGSVGILKGHAPMIASVSSGTVKYRLGTNDFDFPVRRGVVEVRDNTVTILCG